MILAGESLEAIMTKVDAGRDAFLPIRKEYLLYK